MAKSLKLLEKLNLSRLKNAAAFVGAKNPVIVISLLLQWIGRGRLLIACIIRAKARAFGPLFLIDSNGEARSATAA